MGPIELIIGAAIMLLALPLAALWVFALADVVQRDETEFPPTQFGANTRLVWLFLVLVFNIAGALAYYVGVMRAYPRRRR